MKKILFALIFIAIPTTTFAFTENTSIPTQNNTPLPINSSSNTQLKNGAFISDSYMQADVFYDRYNAGYYLQPRGTNRLNYIVADNTLTYGNSITNGEVQGAFFRDRNDGNFYVDPNGNSRVVAVYADYIYSYGYADVRNIYLRDAGRWASQMGSLGGRSWRNVYQLDSPTWGDRWLQCADNEVMSGMYYNPTSWHIMIQCRPLN
jgi:hypothetical protein